MNRHRASGADQGRDPRAQLNLVCLPYAGGSAAVYREWTARLPDWINLVTPHLPGRGIRNQAAPVHRWDALLDLLVDDMQPLLEQPFAIFGNSMGALIGIELAQALRTRHGVEPVWFGASACTAPSQRERELHWHSCPEDTFLAEVRALNGMPEELLANRDFMDLVLPVLRADFHLCGSYEYPARVPLRCPLLAIQGTTDKISQKPLNVSAWSRETTGPFLLRSIEAGHFFINTQREAVIDLVIGSLYDVVSSKRMPAPAKQQLAV